MSWWFGRCEVQLEKQLYERCAERFDTAFKSWSYSFLTIIYLNLLLHARALSSFALATTGLGAGRAVA